jgi:hypothetical protein
LHDTVVCLVEQRSPCRRILPQTPHRGGFVPSLYPAPPGGVRRRIGVPNFEFESAGSSQAEFRPTRKGTGQSPDSRESAISGQFTRIVERDGLCRLIDQTERACRKSSLVFDARALKHREARFGPAKKRPEFPGWRSACIRCCPKGQL